MIRAAEWIAAIFSTVAVLVLLIVRATNAGPLWRDEAALLQLAQLPRIREVAANFQHEAFPLPFPLLLRSYTGLFGGSDAILRLFGFIIGFLTIGAAWFNSRKIGDRGPLVFLALFGLNGTFLIWGTSVRGYGLGCFFLILSIGLTAKTIADPTKANAIAATVAATAAIQIMINAIPLIAAIALSALAVLIIQHRFREAKVLVICSGTCALSFLPYVQSYLGADWNVVLKYPTTLLSLWEKCRLSLGEPERAVALLWSVAGTLALVALLYHWISRTEKSANNAQLLFLIFVTTLSIAAYFAFLKILSYPTQLWYYLPLLCALAAAIDLIVAIVAHTRWFNIALLLFSLSGLVFLPLGLWKRSSQRMGNIDIVAQKLETEATADDLIVVNPWHYAPSFYRYYHGPTRWITNPTMNENRFHRYDLMKAKAMEVDPLADVRTAIRETLQDNHAVWIVGGARPADPDMPRLGPAPNPYFGWAGYMSYWSMEIGSFLNEHVVEGKAVLEPHPNTNQGENVPLLIARGWRD